MRSDNNYDIKYLSAYIRKGNGKVMEKKLKLPIGIENFEKLRTEGFYYIDKTGLITELLENLQHGARYAVWKRDSGHTFAELSASGTRGHAMARRRISAMVSYWGC